MEPIMITHDGVKIYHMADKVYALNIRHTEVAPQHVINVTSEQQKNCKYFSSAEARSAWLHKRNEFIDYVLSFYGENGIYSDFFSPALTKDDVMFATNAIDKAGLIGEKSASEHIDEGDTFSREMVRDYIFLCRNHNDIEWEHMVKPWFDVNVKNNVVEHLFLIKK